MAILNLLITLPTRSAILSCPRSGRLSRRVAAAIVSSSFRRRPGRLPRRGRRQVRAGAERILVRGAGRDHLPRTWKGVLFVGRAFGYGAVQEMKVWPFAVALAEGGCKPPHAALAEDRRGERCGKGARDASGGDRKDGAQSWFSGIAVEVSLLNKVTSKPGCSRSARDESGGCPLFWPGGVRHVGDVSPVCGSCMERGKARLDTAVEDGERELPRGGNRKGFEYRRGACWRTGP